MQILEEIRLSIENGRSKDVERLVLQALDEKIDPNQILEQGMIPAMHNVGEYYKKGKADIPRILSAARGMRNGMNVLEDCFGKDESRYVGTIIFGTVEGDLHDVGKNLVAIMFRCAGFKVIDLGVDVSERRFLKAVKENTDVSIVCISSLLTTSIPGMRQVVKSIRKFDKEKRLKIMVGGGCVTKELADEMGADGYTENAVEATEMAKTFLI